MTNRLAQSMIDFGNTATTANGAEAFRSTTGQCLDLFSTIGASRGKDITALVLRAMAEDEETATRVLLYARDIRQGIGERKVSLDGLFAAAHNGYLNEEGVDYRLMDKLVELGRIKDLTVFFTGRWAQPALRTFERLLKEGNNLAFKWAPRVRSHGYRELIAHLGMHHGQYTRFLAKGAVTVEQLMTSNRWDAINFPQVPSIAAARYQRCFSKHQTERYAEYRDQLKKGTAKINAATITPVRVLQALRYGSAPDVAEAQWKALPNLIAEGELILPMIDTSGSMSQVTIQRNLQPLDVAVSLGLYIAERNTGPFQDLVMTFDKEPKFLELKGNLDERYKRICGATRHHTNTNIDLAFERLLELAVKVGAKEEEMPRKLLIISDMQFDRTDTYTAHQRLTQRYAAAGYKVPEIVFWNVNSYDNQPVKRTQRGVALVSGYSPNVLTSVLGGEIVSPELTMLNTVYAERYNYR